MDFVREHLKTKKNVNLDVNQERSNNIELEVLADTVYIQVKTYCFSLTYFYVLRVHCRPNASLSW